MSSSSQETLRPAFPSLPQPPPTLLSYGLPFTESCPHHVTETFHKSRAYILVSASLSKQTPYLKQLEEALGPNHAGTWIGLRPHTYWDDLVPIINEMREKNADVLITLGGSTLADGAKMITYALANGVDSIESMAAVIKPTSEDLARKMGVLIRNGVGNDPSLPLVFIPTSLSGGEYSKYSGGTISSTNEKVQLMHNKMYASLVILDPALTVTTPLSVWLQSGVRAIDHCAEAICSVNATEAVDEAAAEGLKLLIPGLLGTKRDTEDLDARIKSQLGANLSMTALANTPPVKKGASHGIGHQLGPLGVGHGHTSCILLPAVMKYNAQRADQVRNDIRAMQAKLKDVLWATPEAVKVFEKRSLVRESSDVGDALRALFDELEMPRSLKEVGVGQEKLEALAINSVGDPYAMSNPVKLEKPEQVMEILEMVVGH